MASGIKRYDFYRKAIDGLQTKTSIGGLSKFVSGVWFVASLISGIIIILLTVFQTVSFVKTKTSTTLNVESQLDNIIPSKLDFSLFYMSCDCIDLDKSSKFMCSFWRAFWEYQVQETHWCCCMLLFFFLCRCYLMYRWKKHLLIIEVMRMWMVVVSGLLSLSILYFYLCVFDI